MEGKNILLVVICVCAFLVIVFGIALWFTLPKNGRDQGRNEIKNENKQYDIFTFVKNGEEAPGLIKNDEEKTGESMLVVGEKPEETPLPESTPLAVQSDAVADKGNDDVVTLKVPLAGKKADAGVSAPVEKRAAQKPVATARPQAPVQKKMSTGSIEYWIQAGSYKIKSLAEAQRGRLADHGFAAQIITRELSGRTYYRVRIGPYSNKAEAEKFLAWVKVIEGLEESYITQIKSARTVN